MCCHTTNYFQYSIGEVVIQVKLQNIITIMVWIEKTQNKSKKYWKKQRIF